MRPRLKVALRALALLLVAAAAVAAWKRDELVRLRAVVTLFDEDRIVGNFSAMDRMFFTKGMSGGDAPSPLPRGEAATLPPETADWVRERSVTALVVLRDGAVVAEEYYQGTGPADLRISWSVAKSMLSVVLGTLHHDGSIPDLDAQVTDFVPALVGTAYEGATIRNVLNMASGVAFDEDYMDFWSDINRMGRELALGGTLDGFAASQKRRRGEPGADWQYVSVDTHVLGMVMRGATGRSIPELMEERLFRPLGLEADPFYLTDGRGEAFVLGGLNLTTRDYARFGQMVLQGGAWQGRQVVPEEWLDASTVPSAPGGAPYGFQWWIPSDAAEGEFFARGVYGQYVYVNRSLGVVIATNGADRSFTRRGVHAANLEIFRTIAAAVRAAAGVTEAAGGVTAG
jgi:CubicO group peptidase (beta-lactamase class C family)